MYWVRVVGGTLYIAGMLLFGWNIFRTWQAAPGGLRGAGDPGGAAAERRTRSRSPRPRRRRRSRRASRAMRLAPHAGSGCRCTFTVLVTVAVVVASLFEIIPTFLIKSNVPTIASVKPYTPLELGGPRHLHPRGLLQLPLADDPPVPLRDRALRRVLQAGRVRLRPPVPVGLAPHRAGPGARGRQVSRPLARAAHARTRATIDAEVDHAGLPAAC